MNFHDSERVSGLLEQDGYERTDHEAGADLVIINTCSVRERAAEKLYTRLGEVREAWAEAQQASPERSRRVVAVMGCVAQQEGAALLRRDRSIDVVVGTQRLKQLPQIVDDAMRSGRQVVDINPHDDVTFPLGVARHADPVRARVTIIEGCNEFCAFCVVPYTRGHERMRPAADIVAEAREAARTGHREVQLLGQIVNHYQAPDDPACDFAALLERVSGIPGIDRIRFASPHPRHVSDRLIAAIRDLPKVCKHLHLPVQSGSNAMLRAMRRRYTRDDYFALVDRLRGCSARHRDLDRHDRRIPGRDGCGLRTDARPGPARAVSLDVLVQVFAAAEHARDQADARRCPGSREDATNRRAAAAAGARFSSSGTSERWAGFTMCSSIPHLGGEATSSLAGHRATRS